MERDEETDLIAAAASGDDDAFSALLERYQKPVYNLCYRLLGNHGDAEDASQEAFMKAYRGLKKYDPKRPFISWLLAIAYNQSVDQLRKRRVPLVGLEAAYDRSDRQVLSPELAAEMQSESDALQRALSTLNVKDRAAVVLRYWYDYSYDEIAQTLSLTTGAVKSRLHRARRELMEAWNPEESLIRDGQSEPSTA